MNGLEASNRALPAPDRDLLWILLAYLAALIAAGLTLWQSLVPIGDSLLLRVFVADVVATLVIFGFSSAFNNASFYDAYWSVAPPFLAGYFLWAQNGELDLRALLLLLLVFAWAIRLTHNWARGWTGLAHIDWRYVDLSAQTGRAWPLVNLLGIHLFPTVLVFVGCVSLQLSLAPDTGAFGALDLLATLVGGSALWLEYTADNQLREFRLNPDNQGTTLTTGVWSWCRHPNYLGEIGFWVALFLFAWAAAGNAAFDLAIWGPIAMLVLFAAISIPMIERRLATRQGYAEHKAKSFALLPLSHLRRGPNHA